VREVVAGHGQAMARFRSRGTASEEASRPAGGGVEGTTDAGTVNTRAGGRDGLAGAKRRAGKPAAPEA